MADERRWPPLDWQRVAAARAGGRVGGVVIYHPTVGSTNTLGRELLRAGAADGTIVLADEQTAGRGRHGRRWTAPARSGIALSLLLRLAPDFPLYTLTMVAALAVSDAVRDVVDTRCMLKWPNDVLVDGAKVAGILLELDDAGASWSVVVGIGLNVNAAPAVTGAGSLAGAVGRPVAREPLLIRILSALDAYLILAAHEPEAVLRPWRERLATLGQPVRVQAPDGVVEGLAVGVDAEGALLVRLADGAVRPVHAGDVTLAGRQSSVASRRSRG